MSDSELSVADAIFSAQDQQIIDQAGDTDVHPAIVKVRDRIEAEVKSVDWPTLRRVVIGKLAELLDEPIAKPLLGAWRKYDELLEYCDRGKYPPDVSSLVPLAEHTIKATFNPALAILLHNVEITRLRLLVTLALKVQGIHLEIRDAKITKVHTGSCQVSGEIAIEGQTFYAKKPAPLTLPGTIELEPGIALVSE